MVFADYAKYYNLLYKDKNYVAEANYIISLINKYKPDTKNILDIGCGTGLHAELFSKAGFQVHGVDLSSAMLQQAQQRANEKLSFSQANIQKLGNLGKYDVITALFHVISYQTTQEMLEKTFGSVCENLAKGGLFIFDCWYGPAVLTTPPEVRVKKLCDAELEVTRIAQPEMDVQANTVDVNYSVFVKNRNNNVITELQETHKMRYLFTSEIELLLNKYNLKKVDSFEFMTNKKPSSETWGVCFVVQA